MTSDKDASAPYRSTQQDRPARSNNNIGESNAWRYSSEALVLSQPQLSSNTR